tara:strand:- start:306 stop:770 length:465 start_codon:yes stop_codon:yes gene_type:complete
MTTIEPTTTSKPPQKHDVEVNWEDQQRICAFGRLNNRVHELRAMIASREVQTHFFSPHSNVDFSLPKQKQLEDTEEAESEITFADDDTNCDLVVGECFFETEKVKAEEMLQTKVTSERKSIEENKEELTSVERAMEQLKGHLYGKFGSSINLEE